MMFCLSSGVKQHPLITFFVLALALSWWCWPLYALGLLPVPIASFGPFLAALVVLAVTRGKTGVGGLLRRMARWRVGLRWYAVALLLPVGLSLAAALLNVCMLTIDRCAARLAERVEPIPAGCAYTYEQRRTR